MTNRFASALSTNSDSSRAVAETCWQIQERLQRPPTLALAFLSAHHRDAADEIAERLERELRPDCLIGCTAEAIVGVATEIESEPALSLWAAVLPHTKATTMWLEFIHTPEGHAIVGWPDELAHAWPADATLIMLGDPFTFPAELLLQQINDEQAGVPVVGGMASAASQPGENRLLLGRRCVASGAVAVMLSGGLAIQTVVSQGCRPIGKPLVVTKAERDVIYQLGGRPAYEQLVEVFESLPTREQQMLHRGLHLGRVVSEYQDTFEQGDFLVRNVSGVDPQSGSLLIGDWIRPGQTVQFHLRDAETADAELRQLLAKHRSLQPEAALLFTCNGRGTRLFAEPHHDAGAIGRVYGKIPLAGFFAAGELGPVGGRNFLHGFTASLALFVDPSSSRGG